MTMNVLKKFEMVVRVEIVIEIMGGDFEDGGGADRVVFLYFATGGICVVIDYLCPIVIVGYCGITMAVTFFFGVFPVNSDATVWVV